MDNPSSLKNDFAEGLAPKGSKDGPPHDHPESAMEPANHSEFFRTLMQAGRVSVDGFGKGVLYGRKNEYMTS